MSGTFTDQDGTVRLRGDISDPRGALTLLTRTLTPDELTGITDAAPLELLPAVPGIIHAYYDEADSFRVGATQYANGADLSIVLGPAANGWRAPIAAAAGIRGAVDRVDIGGLGYSGWSQSFGANIPPSQVVNQPLVLALNPASAPNTPFDTGDGILTISVLYADLTA